MQQYRGSDTDRRLKTFRAGELAKTTGTDHLSDYMVVGDGTTAGGKDFSVGNDSPGWPSGSWIFQSGSLLAFTSAATTPNILIYVPILIPAGPTRGIQNIGCNVTGAGGGLENMRLGLYRNENGRPTTKVYDYGNLSVSSSGFKTVDASGPQPLRPGWYWTAFVTDSSTATFDTLATAGYRQHMAWVILGYKRPTLAYQVWAFGALPATAAPAGVIPGGYPIVHLQGV